jgi:pyruvate-ferredoxin/flavodoxin oxidoreductase
MRYNPALAMKGENPLKLDSPAPKISLKEYAYRETRYKMLTKSKPEEAARLLVLAQEDVRSRWQFYEQMAKLHYGKAEGAEAAGTAEKAE